MWCWDCTYLSNSSASAPKGQTWLVALPVYWQNPCKKVSLHRVYFLLRDVEAGYQGVLLSSIRGWLFECCSTALFISGAEASCDALSRASNVAADATSNFGLSLPDMTQYSWCTVLQLFCGCKLEKAALQIGTPKWRRQRVSWDAADTRTLSFRARSRPLMRWEPVLPGLWRLIILLVQYEGVYIYRRYERRYLRTKARRYEGNILLRNLSKAKRSLQLFYFKLAMDRWGNYIPAALL
jgi:hypothetical protein